MPQNATQNTSIASSITILQYRNNRPSISHGHLFWSVQVSSSGSGGSFSRHQRPSQHFQTFTHMGNLRRKSPACTSPIRDTQDKILDRAAAVCSRRHICTHAPSPRLKCPVAGHRARLASPSLGVRTSLLAAGSPYGRCL
jgi:hypothetical protein